ncbi:hypothetical protein ES705_26418 [subsurface metagenome]
MHHSVAYGFDFIRLFNCPNLGVQQGFHNQFYSHLMVWAVMFNRNIALAFGIVLDKGTTKSDPLNHALGQDLFRVPAVMTEDTYALLQGNYDVHTNFTYSFQSRDYINLERAATLEEKYKKKPQLREVIAPIP